MTREDSEGWIILGVAAVVGYYLWKTATAAGSAVGAAADSVESSIANLFPGTSPNVVPQGSVVLPNGTTVPVSSLTSQGFNADGSLSMSDNTGITYSVTSLGNGTYQAS